MKGAFMRAMIAGDGASLRQVEARVVDKRNATTVASVSARNG
jgi:hypothetical protein